MNWKQKIVLWAGLVTFLVLAIGKIPPWLITIVVCGFLFILLAGRASLPPTIIWRDMLPWGVMIVILAFVVVVIGSLTLGWWE